MRIMTSTAQLGDFLRACRARVTPKEAGLPDDGRPRRVPGLRREEVARLANVSVDYLVRLEQGRARSVSRSVLESLAEALALRSDEREYLLSAAETTHHPEESDSDGGVVLPQTRLVLDGLGWPALLMGRRMDVLAWNALAVALITDFEALPPRQLNMVWLTFRDPFFREFYADWPDAATDCVARLRMDAARYPGDPRLAALVEELSAADPDFRSWWGVHQVQRVPFGRKSMRHPRIGPLSLDYQRFTLGHDDQYLVVYTAEPGSAAHQALASLTPAE
jgi:transcriptional regulator with XRE-family HTH domain